MRDGSWAAFDIKLGANQIDTAAESLIKLKNSIAADEKGYTTKSFMCNMWTFKCCIQTREWCICSAYYCT